MATTAIEWATHVWNPFTGCDRVSPGCAHCYAIPTAAGNQRKEIGRARVAAEQGKPLPVLRYQNDGDPKTSGPGFGFTVHWDKLERPERFPAGARVFVNSMSDVFHEEAPDEAIAKLFAVFASRPDVDWLVLTKRAERMPDVVARLYDPRSDLTPGALLNSAKRPDHIPLRNVWLGVSIENRRFVHRADLLRETPAAVRFISAEPLLSPLVYDSDMGMARDRDWRGGEDDEYGGVPEHLRGDPYTPCWLDGADLPELDLTGIDWLIVGGESGPGHRPIREEWVRDLRDACFAKSPFPPGQPRADLIPGRTAFFFKQWGGATSKSGGRELDGRTWDEFPEVARG